jgi:type III secretion system FlhB-like substrate exporter
MKEQKAAALKYDRADISPKILARGIGTGAEVLRRIASMNDVPIVESPALADSLSGLNPFDYVPEKYWTAVAEILKFVYETRGNDELHKS